MWFHAIVATAAVGGVVTRVAPCRSQLSVPLSLIHSAYWPLTSSTTDARLAAGSIVGWTHASIVSCATSNLLLAATLAVLLAASSAALPTWPATNTTLLASASRWL